MTKAKLQSLLQSWQKKLRIQDWRVTLRLIPMDDYGTCKCNAQEKSAAIDILELTDPKWDITWREPENTLVHELLHVLLWELLGDNTEDASAITKEEQVVNIITDALLQQ